MDPTTPSEEGAGQPTAAPLPGAPPSACSCHTLPRREIADYAARARAQAGLLLEDETSSRPDLRLARLLLRESFIAAASAITGAEPCQTLDQARSALEAHPDFATAEGGVRRSFAKATALGSECEPRFPALREAESLVAELVNTAYGKTKPRPVLPGRRWFIIGATLLTIGVVAGPRLIRLLSGSRWQKYRWHASSCASGFKADGILGEHGVSDLVFHTDLQNGPWVVIDMLATRSINQIIIKNREDCCYDRGIPLVVEVGSDENTFSPVGRRGAIFDTWNLEFAAREARYVRLRSESNTILHMADVRIP
jgi:hypothetical protein